MGEEGNPNDLPEDLNSITCVVYDELDGSKAWARGQSYGCATQVALVINGVVVAAVVGNVHTGELYGYDPESSVVYHIHGTTTRDLQTVDRGITLANEVALLQVMPESLHPAIADLVRAKRHGGIMERYEVGSGSLTMALVRLWRGEIGLCALPANAATPWDMIPAVAIGKKLGMVWVRGTPGGGLEVHEPPISLKVYPRPDMLVVHGSFLHELPIARAGG